MHSNSPSAEEILRFLQPNEPAGQFYQRIRSERVPTGLALLDQCVVLRPGVVLEAAGPHASGKTELLLQAALHVLLAQLDSPHSVQQALQGQQLQPGGSVLLLDLDAKFDGLRLVEALQLQIAALWQQQLHLACEQRAGMPPLPQPLPAVDPAGPAALAGKQRMLEHALARLHVVRCHSSLQLLATLAGLPQHLQRWQAQGMRCQLLLLDNIGAFFWQDRAVKNVVPGLPTPALSLFEVHKAIAQRLEALCQHYRLPVIATKHAAVTLSEAGGDGAPVRGQLQQREYMPVSWQSLVTDRLLLCPSPRGVVYGARPPGAGAALPAATALLLQLQAHKDGSSGHARWQLPGNASTAGACEVEVYVTAAGLAEAS